MICFLYNHPSEYLHLLVFKNILIQVSECGQVEPDPVLQLATQGQDGTLNGSCLLGITPSCFTNAEEFFWCFVSCLINPLWT